MPRQTKKQVRKPCKKQRGGGKDEEKALLEVLKKFKLKNVEPKIVTMIDKLKTEAEKASIMKVVKDLQKEIEKLVKRANNVDEEDDDEYREIFDEIHWMLSGLKKKKMTQKDIKEVKKQLKEFIKKKSKRSVHFRFYDEQGYFDDLK
jgi:predicted ribonuclease YlaK